MKATEYIADFDSASVMVRALGRVLRGTHFPGLGIQPRAMAPLIAQVNRLPVPLRDSFYSWMGWMEAIKPRQLEDVDAEQLSRWVVSEYPRRRYPAAMIGSSNGANVHLCAALGIPWLPQTLLIPVRRRLDPDEPKLDMEWGRRHAPLLLDRNPELQLHHMNDANQDRLMIQRMTYFRVKRRRLGEAYERFLEKTLEPGGTLFLVECGLSWPTLRMSDRHVFQHGALGGATADEFRHGSVRVREYLRRYRNHRRRWDALEPDGVSPEAEWGFEPALRDDVAEFAARHGYRVRRILFDQPEDFSPLVADFYRWWYRARGMPAGRLVVESFAVMEPWWMLRTGSVPFWMVFNKEPSASALEAYLDGGEPYEHIHMMLFSHGVDSVGLVPIERWRSLIGRARRSCSFLGVDEQAYPRDFAAFIRYNIDFEKKIPARYPMPSPLPVSRLDAFLTQCGGRYPVQWLDHHLSKEMQQTRVA
jgi:hypothetical protein